MILDCIRHGVTASNLEGRFNYSGDEDLAPPALEVLASLRAIEAAHYTRVFVSPMRRAEETARRLGLKDWISEPRLAERGFGRFEGLTTAECAELHSPGFEIAHLMQPHFEIPDGETRAAHWARVQAWLGEVAAQRYERVLAVTHGGVIDFLYRQATGHPLHGSGMLFGGDNLTRSRFELAGGEIRLIAFAEPLARADDPISGGETPCVTS
jgi:broad specificity phosphatase PhoE